MVQATQVQLQVDVGPQPLRIAIIGAGAGGSSAGKCYDISTQIDMTNRDCAAKAFWINKAKERQDMNVEVHVFDKVNFLEYAMHVQTLTYITGSSMTMSVEVSEKSSMYRLLC